MVIAFSGSLGPVPLDVVLREKHYSDLAITQIPIERGADISDHAYRQPDKIDLEIADHAAVTTWNALKAFQVSRVPFTLVSGLQVYSNMLIEHMDAERDATHGNILYGHVHLTEVIIVETSTASGGGGKPGGANSTQQAKPSASRSKDAVTASRATSTVARGDNVAETVPAEQNQSILRQVFQ